MDDDLALLHQKIDLLTSHVEMQNQRLEELEVNGNDSQAVITKLDYLTQQFEVLCQHQDEMDELKRDLIPIANHMVKLSIDELAEIGTEFQSEDLLFLVKRHLRDTHMLVGLLDRLESTVDLFDETKRITDQIFNQAVISLDSMEREGYFAFARQGWRIVERIVTEFSEDDVQALGDNVIAILTTVRSLTQPEIMSLTNNALEAFQDQDISDEDVSMWALMKDLSDPKVRKGMARLINMVKVLADQPGGSEN